MLHPSEWWLRTNETLLGECHALLWKSQGEFPRSRDELVEFASRDGCGDVGDASRDESIPGVGFCGEGYNFGDYV